MNIDASKAGILNVKNHTGFKEALGDVIRLNRSLTRIGDVGQTMHADFKGNAYGSGTPENGVDLPLLGEELFSVQRAGPKWEQGADGLLREVPANTLARVFKDGVCQGVSVEDAATNLIIGSNYFSNGGLWSNNNNRLTFDEVNGIFKDNSIPGIKVTADGSGLSVLIATNVGSLTSNSETASLFIESDTAPACRLGLRDNTSSQFIVLAELDFETGAVTIQSSAAGANLAAAADYIGIGPNGGRLYRFRVTGTPTNAGNERRVLIYPIAADYDGASILHHAQIDISSSASSAIITTDSPVTRPADNINKTDVNLNPERGSFLLRYIRTFETGFAYILGLGNANDEQLVIGNSTQSNTYLSVRAGVERVLVAGSYQSNYGDLEYSGFTYERTIDGFLFKFYCNGELVGETTIERLPNGFTTNLAIGKRRANSNTLYANTEIESVIHTPIVLSESEMMARTTL